MADKEMLRLENLFGAMSLALVDKMEKAFADETGLGPSAIAAIVQIGTEPGLTIETLRRMIALSHSATVRLVDQLVASGLVLRAGGVEGDKRARSLQLTERGRELFERSLAARRSVIHRAFAVLGPEETKNCCRHWSISATIRTWSVAFAIRAPVIRSAAPLPLWRSGSPRLTFSQFICTLHTYI